MRRIVPFVVATSLLMAADSSGQERPEPKHYFKLELDGQRAKVEIRGRLDQTMSTIRGDTPTLKVGNVTTFLLISKDEEFRKRVRTFNHKTVIATGTVSLATSESRRYDPGTFLGRPVAVDVISIEAADR